MDTTPKATWELWQILVFMPRNGQPIFNLSFARDPLKLTKSPPTAQAAFSDGHVEYKIYWWGEAVSENALRGWAREVRRTVIASNKRRDN